MSTVNVQSSGDTPTVLPVGAADVAAALQSYLAAGQTILTQMQQSGLSAQEYAALAQAAANTAQAVAQSSYARRVVTDQSVTGLQTDIHVEFDSLSAARTYTLPLASAAYAGRPITISDASGSCSPTNTITVLPSGSDTLVNGQSSIVLDSPGASVVLLPTDRNSWIVR